MGCPCGTPGELLGPALLAAAVVQVGLLVDTRVVFQEGPGDTGGLLCPPLFRFLTFLGRPPGIRSHAQVNTYLEK